MKEELHVFEGYFGGSLTTNETYPPFPWLPLSVRIIKQRSTIDPFGQFPYNLIIIFDTKLVHIRITTILPDQRDSLLSLSWSQFGCIQSAFSVKG